jgi:hypothetical protein
MATRKYEEGDIPMKYVIIDYLEGGVISYESSEEKIRSALSAYIAIHGDEMIDDESYRYVWEEWSDEKFLSWQVEYGANKHTF